MKIQNRYKFRCWDVLQGKMIYFNKLVRMDTENLMQSTSLKDRNGKEIYEGDIVKGCEGHQGQSEVFYGYGQWQPFSYLGTYNGNEFEVIGNIYSNPELLSE